MEKRSLPCDTFKHNNTKTPKVHTTVVVSVLQHLRSLWNQNTGRERERERERECRLVLDALHTHTHTHTHHILNCPNKGLTHTTLVIGLGITKVSKLVDNLQRENVHIS